MFIHFSNRHIVDGAVVPYRAEHAVKLGTRKRVLGRVVFIQLPHNGIRKSNRRPGAVWVRRCKDDITSVFADHMGDVVLVERAVSQD